MYKHGDCERNDLDHSKDDIRIGSLSYLIDEEFHQKASDSLKNGDDDRASKPDDK